MLEHKENSNKTKRHWKHTGNNKAPLCMSKRTGNNKASAWIEAEQRLINQAVELSLI